MPVAPDAFASAASASTSSPTRSAPSPTGNHAGDGRGGGLFSGGEPPPSPSEWQALRDENLLLQLQVERQEKLIWELRRQIRGENTGGDSGTRMGTSLSGETFETAVSGKAEATTHVFPAATSAGGAGDGGAGDGGAGGNTAAAIRFPFPPWIRSRRVIGAALALLVGGILLQFILSSSESGPPASDADTPSKQVSDAPDISAGPRTDAPSPANVPAPPAPPEPPVPSLPPSPPPGMVPVAAGTYVIGNASDPYSSPPHEVTIVEPFWIDPYEVSEADYAQYVSATGASPPPHWQGSRTPPPGTEQLPVTRITLAEAESYARWAGKSLPTEVEWEIAALDSEPTGVRQKATAPLPVTVSPPQGRFRLYHMLGNVWEWTASPALPYPGSSSPDIPPAQQVIRGGSYADTPRRQQPWYRNWVAPDTRSEQLGFRCVWHPSR